MAFNPLGVREFPNEITWSPHNQLGHTRLVQVSRFAAGTSDGVQCTAPTFIGHRHSHRSIDPKHATQPSVQGSWQW